jgi:LuxR family transcriptional regulator, maltose regulon positive regulatory protein
MTTAISERVTRAQPVRGQESGQLAAEKLAIPVQKLPLLPRQRISDLISKATANRVTVVRGPGGAGKTVACAMWAGGQTPGSDPVAWVSLDPDDRKPERLWANISAALGIATDADPGDSAFPLRLAQAAQRLERPVTLVIDDVQELADSDAVAGLDLLVKHGPWQLRLLLSGRHLAGLAIARLQVGGELAEIGPLDLACTTQEAQEYFAMLGIELPPARLSELVDRTGGWITGLRLAALRVTEPPWQISGDEPLVADYLRAEILAGLSSAKRDFLLRTSVADQISGDLADTLTNGSQGTATLDQLCKENLMISPAAEHAEYRYHPLMLDLLRADLHRDRPAEVPALTARLARWQADHGQHGAALANAARAGDWELGARVLAEAGPQLLLPGQAAELEPVLASFPASSYTRHAAVAGALAAAGLRTGDTGAAQLHLDNATAALPACHPSERGVVGTWLRALRLMHATELGTADAPMVEQATRLASQASAAAGRGAERQAAGLLWTAIGVTALSDLRIAEARDATTRACRLLAAGGRAEFGAQANGWRAIAEAMYGDLLTASDLLADRVALGEGEPDAARLADIATVYWHLAKDETAAARRLLDSCGGHERGHRPGSRTAELLVLAARARLALCEGDQGAARRQLTRLRYEAARPSAAQPVPGRGLAGTGLAGTGLASTGLAGSGLPGLAGLPGTGLPGTGLPGTGLPGTGLPGTGLPGTGLASTGLAVLDADIALGEGNAAGARQVLARASQGGPERADLLLGSAKAGLAQGDSSSALAITQSCLTGAAGQLTLRDQVSALVTAAVAHRRLGQPEQAADQLGFALALAEPHGLYRPFVDGGQAARSALAVLIRPVHPGAAAAARILQRFDTRPARSAEVSVTMPLTGSELAVLRFLPSHMTNQEIAEALFLSINTVKTHLRSVYRKLGVTTRRQAISAAGRLGLL